MSVTIQLRGDSAANWATANPILAEREIGINTDNNTYKIGDGVTAWSSLPYQELSPVSQLITLEAQSDPATPAIDSLYVYAKKIAGKLFLKIKNPFGIASVLQNSLFKSGIQMLSPGSGTSFNYIGMGAATIVGTVTHPVLTSTYLRTQIRRFTITSTNTANSVASIRQTVASIWRGLAPHIGGFFFSCRFAVSSTTAGQRLAVGILAQTTGILTTIAPSQLTDCVILGYDATDTNMQIMYNDSTGVCDKINLGSAFPVNDPTAVYELILCCPANGDSIHYRVTNLVSEATISGEILEGNLPSKATFLTWNAYLNNNGLAESVVLEIVNIYIETDY